MRTDSRVSAKRTKEQLPVVLRGARARYKLKVKAGPGAFLERIKTSANRHAP